jgi:replicative DNA helicase
MLQLERMLDSLQPSVHGASGLRASRPRSAPDEEVELEVLKLLIQSPELCERWRDRLRPDHFAKPTHRRAFELLAEAPSARDVPALAARAQELPNGELLARLVARLAVEDTKSDGPPTSIFAERQFLRLEEIALKRQADSLRRELQRMNPVTSPDEHTKLFAEMARLDGAARRAREAAEGVGSSAS